jgi:putative membrane protein insertion efficiency factor
MTTLIRQAVTLPISFYRRFLSPLKPRTCRFHPTCSAYAQEAVHAHGVIRGTTMGIWRVLRCNPFGGSGYDPVPRCGDSETQPPSMPTTTADPSRDS